MDILGVLVISTVCALLWALCCVAAHSKGFEQGHTFSREQIRADAIACGVARYVCDPESGDVEFEWLTPQPESEASDDE